MRLGGEHLPITIESGLKELRSGGENDGVRFQYGRDALDRNVSREARFQDAIEAVKLFPDDGDSKIC
jgi:hypothetical protein